MTETADVMKLRTPILISLLIIAAMLVITVWGWVTIPPGQQVPTHWDINGQIDGYEQKEVALLLMPGISVVLTILLAGLTRIDPRRSNLAKSAKLYVVSWVGGLLILLAAHFMVVATALGLAIPVVKIIQPAVGLLFVVIGNYLGKTRSNFFAGVRTPWTLSSDYSWEKTHRLAGRLFIATGLLTIAASLTVGSPWDIGILVVGALTAALVSVVMSYFYWRRDPDRDTGKLANGA